MSGWIPVVVFPNLSLNQTIEWSAHTAIASTGDDRITALVKENPSLGLFLARFTNAFGRKVHPSVLLFREDAPKSYFCGEAISGLRDAMSISTVPVNRAQQLNQGTARNFVWSDFYLIYPWMVAKDRSGLTAYTPAMAAFDDLSKFKGQSSPEIFIQSIGYSDFDRPLRGKLIEKWQDRYSKENPSHADIALFRALNMAFSASSIPSGQEITYYDAGRQIALWVSAFEILAHPSAGKADLSVVYELLKKAPWHMAASSKEKHDCYNNRGKPIKSINACWLYGRLYQARNDFLHGNPVTIENLRFPSGRNLVEIAAPLFRMALAGSLPLMFSEEGGESQREQIGRLMQFYGPQDAIEEALLGAHKPPVE